MRFDVCSLTSESLLGRLRQGPDDQAAWGRFVERYGPMIYGWCRHWHLQEADAEDVTQNVLLILAENMRDFRYDPGGSFRAWLKTVAHNAWTKYAAQQRRSGQGSGSTNVQLSLQSIGARDDLAIRLEEEFDRELLDLAMLRVAQRVAGNTWKAF